MIAQAVAEVVRRQVDVGIDIVSDGEMSKISYATYIADRFTGFAGDTPREAGQDLVDFPELLRKLADRGATAKYRRPRCVGEIKVRDTAPDGDGYPQSQRPPAPRPPRPAAFMNAASPGVIAFFQPNDYYRTQDDYLEAVAAALQTEYEGIVRGRHHSADRRPGSGDGAAHHVSRPHAGGVRHASRRGTSRS